MPCLSHPDAETTQVRHMKTYTATGKRYLMTYASNEDSNQTAHPRSLIRVFAVRMKNRCILGYPNCMCTIDLQWRFWSDCANVQADLNRRWTQRSVGTFSDVAAYMPLGARFDNKKANIRLRICVVWSVSSLSVYCEYCIICQLTAKLLIWLRACAELFGTSISEKKNGKYLFPWRGLNDLTHSWRTI